jgi:Kinesin motor domain
MTTRFLRGESCVLFAYGMTNSGKTHTIQGSDCNNGSGLLPRIVDAVLESTKTKNEQTGHDLRQHPVNESHFELHVSMLEIYQEKVFDLLSKRRDKLTVSD